MSEVQLGTTSRRIIRGPKVESRVGKSRVSIWRDVKAGTFPAPVQLGPNSIGWYEDEIDAWLAARPRRTYRAQTPEAARLPMERKHETPAKGAVWAPETADHRHSLAPGQREEQRMPLGFPGQGPPHRLSRQAHSRGHSDMGQLTGRLAGSRKARGLIKHSHRRGERPTT